VNFATTFRLDCIRTGFAPAGKKEVLEFISKLAADTGQFPEYSQKQIFKALMDRERAGSTGFEDGIALPHCALEQANGFVAGLLTVPDGVNFEALDGQPTNLLFFVIGPESRRNDHIHLISAISRIAMDESFREKLLETTSATDAAERLHQALDTENEGPDEQKCLFHVFVQQADLFDELLQIFSSSVPESLCILDAANAGTYVDRLPLFSAFWTNREDRFFKVIIATVNERLQNDLLRRIHTIVGDIDSKPGVMVTVQPVSFIAGSLEL
jgi:mannitol/fructose-specific phosphotransferase system IIA component (Ntr-type)